MSTKYYYFISTLGMLEFGMKSPMSMEAFLENCKRLVTEEDYLDIEIASRDKSGLVLGRNALLNKWQEFCRNCCNECASVRALKKNTNPLDHIKGDKNTEVCVLEALNQVAKTDDPLESEKILDQMKWSYAEELGQGHFFDVEFLIIYAIKLSILERYKHISSGKGEEILESYKEEALNTK